MEWKRGQDLGLTGSYKSPLIVSGLTTGLEGNSSVSTGAWTNRNLEDRPIAGLYLPLPFIPPSFP